MLRGVCVPVCCVLRCEQFAFIVAIFPSSPLGTQSMNIENDLHKCLGYESLLVYFPANLSTPKSLQWHFSLLYIFVHSKRSFHHPLRISWLCILFYYLMLFSSVHFLVPLHSVCLYIPTEFSAFSDKCLDRVSIFANPASLFWYLATQFVISICLPFKWLFPLCYVWFYWNDIHVVWVYHFFGGYCWDRLYHCYLWNIVSLPSASPNRLSCQNAFDSLICRCVCLLHVRLAHCHCCQNMAFNSHANRCERK